MTHPPIIWSMYFQSSCYKYFIWNNSPQLYLYLSCNQHKRKTSYKAYIMIKHVHIFFCSLKMCVIIMITNIFSIRVHLGSYKNISCMILMSHTSHYKISINQCMFEGKTWNFKCPQQNKAYIPLTTTHILNVYHLRHFVQCIYIISIRLCCCAYISTS